MPQVITPPWRSRPPGAGRKLATRTPGPVRVGSVDSLARSESSVHGPGDAADSDQPNLIGVSHGVGRSEPMPVIGSGKRTLHVLPIRAALHQTRASRFEPAELPCRSCQRSCVRSRKHAAKFQSDRWRRASAAEFYAFCGRTHKIAESQKRCLKHHLCLPRNVKSSKKPEKMQLKRSLHVRSAPELVR